MGGVDYARVAGGIDAYTGRGVPNGRSPFHKSGRVERRLYFHETGDRLPDTHGATMYTVSALAKLDDAQQASVMRHGEIALSGTIRTLGDGSVFTYAFQFVSDVPHCSAWAFVLYNCVAFVGTTVRSEDLPPNSRCP